MKKEITIHFSFLVSFFLLITIFKGWFSFIYWPFWLGGVVGTLLPDIDHLIYVYFLKPHEHTSQRALHKLAMKDVKGLFTLLADTRGERTKLIFHTIFFQGIFVILAFFVLTSSGSMFGRGLVLAFLLHLSVDQMVDIEETGNLDLWLDSLSIKLDKEGAKTFWLLSLVVIFLLGILF